MRGLWGLSPPSLYEFSRLYRSESFTGKPYLGLENQKLRYSKIDFKIPSMVQRKTLRDV